MIAVSKKIPQVDLRAQHQTIRDEVLGALTALADSQQFILGPQVAELERQIAAYCGSGFGVGCASGSDALLLAMMALDIGPGDEVITVPYTFFATVGAISRLGARPVFVDIDPDTAQMDANRLAEALERHPNARAVMPVHLFGSVPDMDAILEVAGSRGIPVIEDAAQAIGAEYRGRRVGGIGRLGCFSFFPSKNLGGYGDGGMVTTNDPDLAERVRALRVHGSRKRYFHDLIGFNSRLDTLHAAVLLVKLRYLDEWTAGRQRNVAVYRELLAELNAPVRVQDTPTFVSRFVANQFVIRGSRRDQLKEFLTERGVGTEIYYPLAHHQQVCFKELGYQAGDFPVSEAWARESLALPMYAELPLDDIRMVCQTIAEFYRA